MAAGDATREAHGPGAGAAAPVAARPGDDIRCHGGLQGSTSSHAWPSAEELIKVASMRAALPAEDRRALAEAPEDIRHDLMLCRFLRKERGSTQRATKALSTHLKHRWKFRDVIARARAVIPPDAVDFEPAWVLGSPELKGQFRGHLELTSQCGTNDGMPVALMVNRHFNLRAFAQTPQEEMLEWLISVLEQRNIVLHNQSLREHCMAKVVDARDCLGFGFSQLMAPRALVNLSRIFAYGDLYPEFVGQLVMFNLDPGARTVSLVRRVLGLLCPGALNKCIFAEAGDWQSCVEHPRGLSPLALPVYSRHLQALLDGSQWEEVSTDRRLALRAETLTRGQSCHWQVFCKGAGPPDQGGGAALAPAVRVSVWLFRQQGPAGVGSAAPTASRVEMHLLAPGGSVRGDLLAPEGGVALLEAILVGTAGASVALSLEAAASGRPADPAAAAAAAPGAPARRAAGRLAAAAPTVEPATSAASSREVLPALLARVARGAAAVKAELLRSEESDGRLSVAWVLLFVVAWLAFHATVDYLVLQHRTPLLVA